MNNNTTIALALVCAVLAVGFLFIRGRDVAQQPTFSPPSDPISQTSKDLLEDDEKLEDVVRVEIQREGKDTIVLEKETTGAAGVAAWRMTSPEQMNVRSHEAEAFGRNLNNLQYQISYTPDMPNAVSPEDAGLAPPAGRVAVKDATGKEVAVEVGKRISNTERYVRRVGDNRVCVGKTDLFSALKSSIVEYRDQAIWNFAPTDVTRIEATDRTAEGGPVNYVFIKDGDKWIMASPVNAQTTAKVGEMVGAVSRLRATKWEADAKGSLAAYGLESPATTVTMTVEKSVPVETQDDSTGETDDETEKEPEFEIETQTYVLHLSDRSPIGEDTKTYMRIGDETMVATLMKTTADKLKPVMAEWRDMRITAANIDTASRIAIDVGGETAAFTRKEDAWTFESDGGIVEASQVNELLGAVKSLNAVVFVETDGQDLAPFGLESPRATVAITVPGLEGPQKIAVGDYTDAKTKRLVYLRKNDATSVAKVRTADVDALLKKPLLYRDRAIFSIDAGAISSITREQTDASGGSIAVVEFKTDNGTWEMTSPVRADANQTKLTELAATLASFNASAVVADGGEATAFGLHAPTLKMIMSVDTDQGAQTRSFAATQHDGKYYLKRDDRSSIYELRPETYNRLTAEFRSTQLCSATADDVTSFTIARDGDEHGFVKTDEEWTYQSEPDLPLNQEKVKNLLKQILKLKASRFASHTSDDAETLGLSAPPRSVTLSLADAGTWRLDVSPKSDTALGARAFYASVSSQPGLALIPEADLNRIAVDLDDLEAR